MCIVLVMSAVAIFVVVIFVVAGVSDVAIVFVICIMPQVLLNAPTDSDTPLALTPLAPEQA